MTDKKARLNELVEILDKAARAYYDGNEEIMSNAEYDELYDELVSLEEETGVVLAGSPTVKIGYEVISALPKETHSEKMLSLDKTKEVEELVTFLGDKDGVISWKLDGLTVVLNYEAGKLVKALTRGNGEIGEVITQNAKTFINLPLKIPYQGTLTVRGEAVISYKDFQRINDMIPEMDAKYKNPRNLCSGSVRQLNSEVTADRNVGFYAFSLVMSENELPSNSFEEDLKWLGHQGFSVVEHFLVNSKTVGERVSWFREKIVDHDLPSDGLVLLYDDILYGKSLGATAKFPRNALAFKWRDEEAETILKEIEWSTSRTGLINPIAVFNTVEIEGTEVSRASVHNLSMVESLELGIGDKISVYKANMIIPQIKENFSRSGTVKPPKYCHVCNHETMIKQDGRTRVIYCTNPNCVAKKIGKFNLFVSRNAMNIEFLSESTLERFINEGLIKNYSDIFTLKEHKDVIVNMRGFGIKSYEKLVSSIEKSANTDPVRLLTALGISGIGVANAKSIAKHAKYSWDKIMSFNKEELMKIDGIGPIIASDFEEYFNNNENLMEVQRLVSFLSINEESKEEGNTLEGMTFVITGSLTRFENRKELKEALEKQGAKVASTVSSLTTYLINNDLNSTSSKNKKAKELGVNIITEEQAIILLTGKAI